MPYKLTEFQQRFWNVARLHELRRGYHGYDDMTEICRRINLIEGGEPIIRAQAYMMAFRMKLKRPKTYATVAAVRRAEQHPNDPGAKVRLDAVIAASRRLEIVERARRQKLAITAAEARAKAERPQETHVMDPPPPISTSMGKPPSRTFSMVAMKLDDPTVARRLRDLQHANEGRLTPQMGENSRSINER